MGQEYLEMQRKGAQSHRGQDSAPEGEGISVLDAQVGLPPSKQN